jgi:DNA-binding transcriptional regulator YhcF (GntR family)
VPPDLQDDRPIFIQIKEYIEDGILDGRFAADEPIPSVNRLVEFFGINPVTVLKGIGLLTDAGILYKKRGVGMFVRKDAPEILRKQRAEALHERFVLPLVRRARSLGLTQEELQRILDAAWRDFHGNV